MWPGCGTSPALSALDLAGVGFESVRVGSADRHLRARAGFRVFAGGTAVRVCSAADRVDLLVCELGRLGIDGAEEKSMLSMCAGSPHRFCCPLRDPVTHSPWLQCWPNQRRAVRQLYRSMSDAVGG